MRKRIFSVFLAVAMLFCLIPLSVHAEHQHTFENKHGYDLTNLPEGYSIPCKIYESPCSDECGYSLYSWDVFGLSGQFVYKSGTSGLVVYQHYRDWFENIYGKNATAKKYETGGGSAGTGGVGRRPSGYADDNGTPSYNSNGDLQIVVYPKYARSQTLDVSEYADTQVFTSSNGYLKVSNLSGYIEQTNEDYTYGYSHSVYYSYFFDAPIDGLYYATDAVLLDGFLNANKSKTFQSVKKSVSKHLLKGDNFFIGALYNDISVSYYYHILSYSFNFHPLVLTVIPDTATVNKQISITINNNTWNGNIYQDNSTNLTYIYPQYTTINDAGDTITNISENPIIYDSTTNQYYTYDSVTNNYYYITYVTETPTPTPSPDPTPTPDPGTDPTPTLRPSTPESGESGGSSGTSWWDKLLNKIGDAIIDGLLGAISAVLKLIFKLFTTILGWIVWLASQVLTLFPFLPPGLGALLIGGVVVCFIIGLIKFIRG